jgi:hypothetical protein
MTTSARVTPAVATHPAGSSFTPATLKIVAHPMCVLPAPIAASTLITSSGTRVA